MRRWYDAIPPEVRQRLLDEHGPDEAYRRMRDLADPPEAREARRLKAREKAENEARRQEWRTLKLSTGHLPQGTVWDGQRRILHELRVPDVVTEEMLAELRGAIEQSRAWQAKRAKRVQASRRKEHDEVKTNGDKVLDEFEALGKLADRATAALRELEDVADAELARERRRAERDGQIRPGIDRFPALSRRGA